MGKVYSYEWVKNNDGTQTLKIKYKKRARVVSFKFGNSDAIAINVRKPPKKFVKTITGNPNLRKGWRVNPIIHKGHIDIDFSYYEIIKKPFTDDFGKELDLEIPTLHDGKIYKKTRYCEGLFGATELPLNPATKLNW